ncbi:YdcF family protein [Kribbella sp. NBC_01245]|uniref:YdcF family protein n=1 Tax=Kribbella sp. NBC_01245 TaxID=2903578 RepID=UPI002E27C54D|nr:YdcF family protein [Kribbella sp. NBC_01245]
MLPAAITFAIAAIWLLIFVRSFRRDRRLLRNGFYLAITLAFTGIGVLVVLGNISQQATAVIVIVGLLAVFLAVLALPVLLVANGVLMLRREGRRPANLLSLAAGLLMIGLFVLSALVRWLDWEPLLAFDTIINGVLAYLSLVFFCFLLYSIVYGRIPHRQAVDFIVVLGSGLRGSRVPPLLASRLDRARKAYDEEVERGRQPILITSGGQGPGEDVPESVAMADYLIARDFPAELVMREEKSTTTMENLTFSRKIMTELRPSYRCVVVTNNFHVMRAALMARKAGVNGQVIGSPTAAYFWPSATIREFVAILVEHRWINLAICGLIVLFGVLPYI